MSTQLTYWTKSADNRPVRVVETIEDGQAPIMQNQFVVNDSHYSTPPQTYQAPPQTTSNPFPWIFGVAVIFLCYVAWSASDALATQREQNVTLSQQVMQLRAENQALKEMAAIVAR